MFPKLETCRNGPPMPQGRHVFNRSQCEKDNVSPYIVWQSPQTTSWWNHNATNTCIPWISHPPFQVTNQRQKWASCYRVRMIPFPFPFFCLLSRWCQQLHFRATNLLQNLGFQCNVWLRMERKKMISSKRDGSQYLDLLKYDRNKINTSYSFLPKGGLMVMNHMVERIWKDQNLTKKTKSKNEWTTPGLSWCNETKEIRALQAEVDPTTPYRDVDWR